MPTGNVITLWILESGFKVSIYFKLALLGSIFS